MEWIMWESLVIAKQQVKWDGSRYNLPYLGTRREAAVVPQGTSTHPGWQ